MRHWQRYWLFGEPPVVISEFTSSLLCRQITSLPERILGPFWGGVSAPFRRPEEIIYKSEHARSNTTVTPSADVYGCHGIERAQD